MPFLFYLESCSSHQIGNFHQNLQFILSLISCDEFQVMDGKLCFDYGTMLGPTRIWVFFLHVTIVYDLFIQ